MHTAPGGLKRALMDNTIKETLRAVELNKVLNSQTTIESFVNFSVTILAKGKSENVGNSAQLPYFAIHLSCLKYICNLNYYFIITQSFIFRNSLDFDVDYLQKKSTLNPKSYQSSLMALLKLIDPSTIINPESISIYYGCPSLKDLIEDIRIESKNKTVECVIAATYLIGQMTKLKHFGTLADLSKLWGQSADTLRQVANELKVYCCELDRLKDFGKILTEEIKQSKQLEAPVAQKRTASPRSVTKNSKVTRTTGIPDDQSSAHPLILFNCSSSGPAFGPILY